MRKIEQILLLLTCFSIMMVAAIQRDGRIWGHQLGGAAADAAEQPMRTMTDNTVVINTTTLGKDILGYAGPVPLEIYLKDGEISDIKVLQNNETPDFFMKASKLLDQWKGKSLEEARDMKVDAVSGATFSSQAIIGNMRAAMLYAEKNAERTSPSQSRSLDAKTVAGLIVVLMAAVIPLFYRNKRYRTIQLALNVLVLGLWGGTFLNWSMFVGYFSNGVDIWMSMVPVVMLATAFVYPLFGRKRHYCNHVCPFGSVQELAGRARREKWKLGKNTVKWLTYMRQLLFVVLMVLMLTGVGFEWLDYELFSAFIFQSAAAIVIVLAIVFVLLSVFVPRPYCRFVCPTGTLLKLSEGSK